MTKTLSNASAGKTGRSDNKQGEENGEHTKVSGSPQRSRGNGTEAKENPNSMMVSPIQSSKQAEKKKVGIGDREQKGSMSSKQSQVQSVKKGESEQKSTKVRPESNEQQADKNSTMVCLINGSEMGSSIPNNGSLIQQSEQKVQQMEFVNAAMSKPVSHSFRSGGSTSSVEQMRDRSGDGGGEDEEQTAVTVKQQEKRKRKRVKLENADEGEGLLVQQIYTDDKKTTYMKSTGERFLFDYCKEFETRYKRVLNDQHINMGRIRSRIERKGDIGKRLKEAEQRIVKMEKVQEWLVTEIVGLMRNLDWQPPTGRTPITSVAVDEYEEIVGNILSDKESPVRGDVVMIDDEEQDEDGDDQNDAFLDGREEGRVMTAGLEDEDELGRLDRVPELIIRSPGQQEQEVDQDGANIERIATMTQGSMLAVCKEVFSGRDDEDVDRFLDRFDIWYEMSDLPDEKKGMRLTMQLKGRAEKVIGDLGKDAYKDYERIKKCLLSKFRKGVSQQLAAKAKMETIRYVSYSKFSDFIEELSDHAKVAYPKKSSADLEERIFEAAMNALPADFKLEMKSHMVDSLDQLLEKAPAVEAYLKEFKGAYKGRDQGDSGRSMPIEVNERSNYVSGARLPRGEPGPRQGSQWSRGGSGNRMNVPQRSGSRVYQEPRCYVCGARGHIAINCPNQGMGALGQSRSLEYQPGGQQQGQWMGNAPQYGDRRSTSICYACQGRGHFAYECPSASPGAELRRQGGTRRGYQYGPGGMQGMTDQFANMGLRQAYQPQYQSNPQARALQYQPQQGPHRQNTAMQVDPKAQGPQKNPLPDSCCAFSALCKIRSDQWRMREQEQGRSRGDEGRIITEAERKDLVRSTWWKRRYQEGWQESADQDAEEMRRHPVGVTQREETQEFVPVEERLTIIPVSINGVKFAALFDTGATITLAPRSLADRAKIDLEENDMKIQSVTGHVAALSKKGLARLAIGNCKRRVGINFTEDDQFGTKTPYDIIIGVDAMIDFPPIRVDAKKRVLTIIEGNEECEVNLLTRYELRREEGKVHAIKEVQRSQIQIATTSRDADQ